VYKIASMDCRQLAAFAAQCVRDLKRAGELNAEEEAEGYEKVIDEHRAAGRSFLLEALVKTLHQRRLDLNREQEKPTPSEILAACDLLDFVLSIEEDRSDDGLEEGSVFEQHVLDAGAKVRAWLAAEVVR